MAVKGLRKPLFASALREAIHEGLTRRNIARDMLSGLVVGIIALPLSMALAIATGMPPQTGLYTAMIAGFIAALCGGSRVQVTGPTAAFVVILAPIVSEHGPETLLLASFLAGLILLAIGLARMGKLVEFIPYPVTAGFTIGIAVTIALIQLKDFFGLTIDQAPESNWERVSALASSWRTWQRGDTLIGVVTLGALIAWGRSAVGRRIPAALVVLPAVTLLAAWMSSMGADWTCATIDSRFGTLIDGQLEGGIPRELPGFHWLWGTGAEMPRLDFEHLKTLVTLAIAIALLGAIESLLSAVIADGVTGGRHNPDGELVGQGIANMIAPWFGGFAATGALARTAANIRAGASSPIAAMTHAVFVLIAIVFLAPALGWLPMASMAALLLVIAKNMADFRYCAFVVRTGPRGDAVVLVASAALTVGFDMVIAVFVGVVLAAFIFMRRMAELSGVDLVAADGETGVAAPEGVLLYRVRGPLFFGAAQRAMQLLRTDGAARCAIIDLSQVPMIDATGLVNLESAVDRLWRAGVPVVLAAATPAVRKALGGARFPWEEEGAVFAPSVAAAIQMALKHTKGAFDDPIT